MDDVTATQAASLLGLSERTIRRRIAAGQLPARRIASNRFAIKVQDLPLHHGFADLTTRLDALERRVAALELQQQALLMLRPMTANASTALTPASASTPAAESDGSLGQLHALLAELARETERLAPLFVAASAAGGEIGMARPALRSVRVRRSRGAR